MEAVFGNELLLATILPYVIHGPRNEICRKSVRSVRLVQKLWLETVSRLIQKSSHNVYHVRVGNESCINQECFEKNELKLDQFTSTFTSENHLQISILPVTLVMEYDYLVEENYSNIIGFFTQCGQHLKKVDIKVEEDGLSMPLSFPKFELPNLHTLRFTCMGDQDSDEGNGMNLLQTFLNASSNLKELVLNCSMSPDQFIPINSEYLKLPLTITFIHVENTMTSNLAEVLLQNKLPVLRKLNFSLEDDLEYESDSDSDTRHLVVFRVMEHFRKTLKYIQIAGGPDYTIKFPVMESLETLDLYFSKIEIEPRSSTLQKDLPKLKKIIFHECVDAWITNFAEYGGFSTVEEIYYQPGVWERVTPSIDFKIMQLIHTTLPNLQRVSMSVSVDDISALKYIFGHMENLKRLEIKFCGNYKHGGALKVQNGLLGTPGESMRPNLMNLSDLTWLHLTSEDNPKDEEISLFTDLICQQCLENMMNLEMLLLSARFKPTIEMQNAWKTQRRFMEYRDLVDGYADPFKVDEFFS